MCLAERSNVIETIDDELRAAVRTRVPFHIRIVGLTVHRVGFLLRSGLAGLVLSGILAFVIPPEYKSTAQLMPPDAGSFSGTGLMAIAAGVTSASALGAASNLIGGRTQGATFVGVLTSRTVQDDIIDRFHLREVYGLDTRMGARKKLGRRTSADEDRKSGIITISVIDNDPERARDIAAAYVGELNKLVAQVSTSSARNERVFLESRLKAVKDDLDAVSRNLGNFSSRNATFDLETQGRSMLEAAAKVQAEIMVAESELRGLESTYGAENARVRAAGARLAELQRQLKTFSGTHNETAASLGDDQLYPSVRKLPMLGLTYTDLYRQARIQEAVYEILTKQYELSKVQEAKELPSVKVLDAPDVPEKKIFPPRLAFTAVGGLLALLFALTWLALAEYWESLPEEDPRRTFGIAAAAAFKPRRALQRP